MSGEIDDDGAYLLEALRIDVRGGFKSMKEIQEWLREAVDEDPALDKSLFDRLIRAAEKVREELLEEARTWPARTQNDELDDAFEELNRRGIVALQNAGFDQSDGVVDCYEVAHRLRWSIPTLLGFRKRPRGYAFYHEQDLARGVDGLGLNIGFGAYAKNPKTADAEGLEVGTIIAETLRSHGFNVAWDNTIRNRIHTGPFPWRKRPK